jgi:hypothetical protein
VLDVLPVAAPAGGQKHRPELHSIPSGQIASPPQGKAQALPPSTNAPHLAGAVPVVGIAKQSQSVSHDSTVQVPASGSVADTRQNGLPAPPLFSSNMHGARSTSPLSSMQSAHSPGMKPSHGTGAAVDDSPAPLSDDPAVLPSPLSLDVGAVPVEVGDDVAASSFCDSEAVSSSPQPDRSEADSSRARRVVMFRTPPCRRRRRRR